MVLRPRLMDTPLGLSKNHVDSTVLVVLTHLKNFVCFRNKPLSVHYRGRKRYQLNRRTPTRNDYNTDSDTDFGKFRTPCKRLFRHSVVVNICRCTLNRTVIHPSSQLIAKHLSWTSERCQRKTELWIFWIIPFLIFKIACYFFLH